MPPIICFGSPRLDPITRKALSLPIVNPLSPHGRVFFFAWFSFLLSFLSWYSMSALITVTIRRDLDLSDNEIKNSNIIAGTASLLVRLVAGGLCERFGPRKVLVGLLWASALPCGLAGTVSTPAGLYVIRFFMGVAGGCFVPAQVFVTAWYDKRVISTSTAVAAGWGDSGVGFTFFIMPAIFNSLLQNHNHKERVAWRLSFVVPAILLTCVGFATLLLCDDTPTGRWSERNNFQPPTSDQAIRATNSSSLTLAEQGLGTSTPNNKTVTSEKLGSSPKVTEVSTRRPSDTSIMVDASKIFSRSATLVDPPPPSPPAKTSLGRGLKDVFDTPATFLLAASYFATFGAGLSLNSMLVSIYLEKFPSWDQTRAGHWAAMFGLLNLVTRPVGGLIADVLYRRIGDYRGICAKKYWMSFLTVTQGIFLLWLGLVNPSSLPTLIGGIAGLAVFQQAANGAIYALLPHVNPHVNGLMGGVVGSSGNLGGIVFSIIGRYTGYARTIWITGIVGIAVGVVVSALKPLPNRQRNEMLSRV